MVAATVSAEQLAEAKHSAEAGAVEQEALRGQVAEAEANAQASEQALTALTEKAALLQSALDDALAAHQHRFKWLRASRRELRRPKDRWQPRRQSLLSAVRPSQMRSSRLCSHRPR
jgi:hypothetical protein